MFDERVIGATVGVFASVVLGSYAKLSSVRRKARIDNYDADAFARLAQIADRAEQQLENQARAFREREESLEREKQFYVEKTKQLTEQVEILQGLNEALRQEVMELRSERVTRKDEKAA